MRLRKRAKIEIERMPAFNPADPSGNYSRFHNTHQRIAGTQKKVSLSAHPVPGRADLLIQKRTHSGGKVTWDVGKVHSQEGKSTFVTPIPEEEARKILEELAGKKQLP